MSQSGTTYPGLSSKVETGNISPPPHPTHPIPIHNDHKNGSVLPIYILVILKFNIDSIIINNPNFAKSHTFVVSLCSITTPSILSTLYNQDTSLFLHRPHPPHHLPSLHPTSPHPARSLSYILSTLICFRACCMMFPMFYELTSLGLGLSPIELKLFFLKPNYSLFFTYSLLIPIQNFL